MFSMSVCLTIFNYKHSVGLVECLPSVREVLVSVPSTAKANRTNYIKFRAQWSALYTPSCNCLPLGKAAVQSHETLTVELVWRPRCLLDLDSFAPGAAQGLMTIEMTVRIAL